MAEAVSLTRFIVYATDSTLSFRPHDKMFAVGRSHIGIQDIRIQNTPASLHWTFVVDGKS